MSTPNKETAINLLHSLVESHKQRVEAHDRQVLQLSVESEAIKKQTIELAEAVRDFLDRAKGVTK